MIQKGSEDLLRGSRWRRDREKRAERRRRYTDAEWLMEKGVGNLREHDANLCEIFLERIENVENLTLYGPRDVAHRTGVFSVNVADLDPSELSGTLESDFGLCTRSGVHCAPLAHKTIGTYPKGTSRLSFGPFTTVDDVCVATDALTRIAQRTTVRG